MRHPALEHSAMPSFVVTCQTCAQSIICCDVKEGGSVYIGFCPYCEWNHGLYIGLRQEGVPTPVHANVPAEVACEAKGQVKKSKMNRNAYMREYRKKQRAKAKEVLDDR